MPKTKTRQFYKNVSRTVLIIITIVAAIELGEDLDKFLSILGSLTCTPVAFILPAAFHY